MNPAKDGDTKNYSRAMVVGLVLYILYVAILVIFLVSSWTLKYRANSALFVMNQTIGLHMERVGNPGEIPGAPSKQEGAMFCAVLSNLIIAAIGIFTAVTVIPAISRNNSAEVVFTWILSENELYCRPNLVKVFSCLYIGISSYFGCIPLIQVFCYATAILYETKYFLKRAYGGNATKEHLLFQHQCIVYAQYILLIREINQFGSHIYPDIMLTAFCINVPTTVGMKFYQDLSLAMVIIFLVFDIVVWTATVVVDSLAVFGKEDCEKFNIYWKSRLMPKMSQKRLKLCRLTGTWVGQFFLLKNHDFEHFR